MQFKHVNTSGSRLEAFSKMGQAAGRGWAGRGIESYVTQERVRRSDCESEAEGLMVALVWRLPGGHAKRGKENEKVLLHQRDEGEG